jgi:hypothetical protein
MGLYLKMGVLFIGFARGILPPKTNLVSNRGRRDTHKKKRRGGGI